MDPTPPKPWSELLDWQRAWFEKGFRAAMGGDRPHTPESAYNLDLRIAARRAQA